MLLNISHKQKLCFICHKGSTGWQKYLSRSLKYLWIIQEFNFEKSKSKSWYLILGVFLTPCIHVPSPVWCVALKAGVIVSESVFKLQNHFHKLPPVAGCCSQPSLLFHLSHYANLFSPSSESEGGVGVFARGNNAAAAEGRNWCPCAAPAHSIIVWLRYSSRTICP